jgi:TonB family protein
MQNNGPTKQGKTYRSADAAQVTKPVKPAPELTPDDEAFLKALGYGTFDTPPVFGTGASFYQAYIYPHFQYTEYMADKQAIVEYEFTVGEDGKLRDINIISSTDEAFSKELVRVLKRCPKWTPAMKDGKPVPYTFRNQGIRFTLTY